MPSSKAAQLRRIAAKIRGLPEALRGPGYRAPRITRARYFVGG